MTKLELVPKETMTIRTQIGRVQLVLPGFSAFRTEIHITTCFGG